MRDPAGNRDRVQMEIWSSDGREKLERKLKLSGHQTRWSEKLTPEKVICENMLLYKQDKKTHLTNERETIRSLFYTWTMSGKWQKQKSTAGENKVSGSTRRKETNVGKVKPNDQNLQKTEKKIHR